jgi:hypothetical protein
MNFKQWLMLSSRSVFYFILLVLWSYCSVLGGAERTAAVDGAHMRNCLTQDEVLHLRMEEPSRGSLQVTHFALEECVRDFLEMQEQPWYPWD